jgi:hypothetical protein
VLGCRADFETKTNIMTDSIELISIGGEYYVSGLNHAPPRRKPKQRRNSFNLRKGVLLDNIFIRILLLKNSRDHV